MKIGVGLKDLGVRALTMQLAQVHSDGDDDPEPRLFVLHGDRVSHGLF